MVARFIITSREQDQYDVLPLTQESLTQEPLTQEPLTQESLKKVAITKEPLTQVAVTKDPLNQKPIEPSGFFASLFGKNRAVKIAKPLQTVKQFIRSKNDIHFEQIIREGIDIQEPDTQQEILNHVCGIRDVLCGKQEKQYDVSRVDLYKAIPKHLDLERFSRILLDVMETHHVKPYLPKNDDLQPYRANINTILASKRKGGYTLSRSAEQRVPSNFAAPSKKSTATSRGHKGAHASLQIRRGSICSPGKMGDRKKRSSVSKRARRNRL